MWKLFSSLSFYPFLPLQAQSIPCFHTQCREIYIYENVFSYEIGLWGNDNITKQYPETRCGGGKQMKEKDESRACEAEAPREAI